MKPPVPMNADGSGAMFNRIAHRYDLLNKLMSFGIDRIWRRKLLAALPPNGVFLDVATGTADVAIEIARSRPETNIIGLDPSVGMLDVGRKKVAHLDLTERVELVEGDAQAMPYSDNHFDASCISFGIRNVPDRQQGLQEMARITKPGGKVVVLELSEPRGGLLSAFARFHVHHIIPRLGALISGDKEYRYLQQSIAAFPTAEDFSLMMAQAGLVNVTYERLTLGTAHLYVGTVPGHSG